MSIFSSTPISSQSSPANNATITTIGIPLPALKSNDYGKPASSSPLRSVVINFEKQSPVLSTNPEKWTSNEKKMFNYATVMLMQALPAMQEGEMQEALHRTEFYLLEESEAGGFVDSGKVYLSRQALTNPGVAAATILHELDHILYDKNPSNTVEENATREMRAHQNTAARCQRLIQTLSNQPNTIRILELRESLQLQESLNEMGGLSYKVLADFIVPIEQPLRELVRLDRSKLGTERELLREWLQVGRELQKSDWLTDEVAMRIKEFHGKLKQNPLTNGDSRIGTLVYMNEGLISTLCLKAKALAEYNAKTMAKNSARKSE